VVSQSRIELDIAGITAEVFNQILDYIYTSIVVLTEENIQDILQVCDE
jgi:hypothetical protein